jgi:ubiquinone/menaquinone biosynthesis C-methylase UbiE
LGTDSPCGDPPDNRLDLPRLAAIYDRTAAFYDSVVADLQAPAKLVAIETLDRRPGERFLEVGVGTAWVFGRIIASSGAERALGADIAPGMLEVARGRLEAEWGVAHSPLLLADATALPFAGGCFDCLLCTYTLEVLPSRAIVPALHEMRRVLAPGGRLVALNLTAGEAEDAAMTSDWLQRFASDPEAFGGARPLLAARAFEQAGLVEVRRRYVGGQWPSEVLRGIEPRRT